MTPSLLNNVDSFTKLFHKLDSELGWLFQQCATILLKCSYKQNSLQF